MAIALVCLPYAGAGATFFRAWARSWPDDEVAAVQLPGREELFRDPCLTSVGDAAAFALGEVRELTRPGDRLVLFGHSLGAILAYELALLLLAEDRNLICLFASGSLAPTAVLGRDSSSLSDEDFVARIEELAGYRHPALVEPELREVLLPTLRADVAMHETYRYRPAPQLPVPITAIRGSRDVLVSAADCARWDDVTSAGCAVVELPGTHMYLAENPAPLRALVNQILVVEEELANGR